MCLARAVDTFNLRLRSGETPVGTAPSSSDETVQAVASSRPLTGGRIGTKVAPFAGAAVLAEASLLLPPGVHSAPAAYVSLALLAVTGIGFLLPWSRLPARATVLVPLLYCASVLALLLAAGPASGIVGIVVLAPVLWTALFHAKWESACVVPAVVVIEFAVSAAQSTFDATVLRRVVLWAVLGSVISVSVHALRDRVLAAHARSVQLREQLEEVKRNEDRLRIALALQDDIVSHIFSVTLTLRGAQREGADRFVSERIDGAVAELDDTVRILRKAVFDVQVSAHEEAPRSPPTPGPSA